MKRILSLTLAVVMMLSCVAVLASCDNTCKHPDANGDWVCDNAECNAILTDPNGYTYNTYMSTFPTKWNPHTYETATDSEIIGYTELGFYTFDYNENKDGFVVVPEMATQMPIDVTADYVGEEWGIEEGEEARAWKIVLRDDLRWEDGKAITAHDFVTSAELLLNPVANNYRADSLYKGDLSLVNAENFFYSEKEVDLDNFTGSDMTYYVDSLVKGEDGVYTTADGKPVHFVLNSALSWLNGKTLTYYVEGYSYEVEDEEGNPVLDEEGNPVIACDMFSLEAWAALKAAADEKGYVDVTDESIANMVSLITYSEDWGETAVHAGCYIYYTGRYDKFEDFTKVGIKAVSDTELVLILNAPLDGFYLHYNLTGSWLVREDLYRSCMSVDENGVYSTTYGTSVDTYMAYGPYKLVSFIRDKQIVLNRNPQWYGYTDAAYEGTYQTTRIIYDYYGEPSAAMTAFLQGKLDAKGLDVDQIKDYASSEHVYYTDGASTFFVAMNPDNEAFKKWEKDNAGKDKQILTVKEFRMALSFSLDRKAFNLACDPTGNSAFAVFNNMICSDPENGTMYRTEEIAKDVILEFWGISQDDIGAGKLYADKDEAIDSITGYNLEGAKELFNQAYDKAIAEGLMTETDVIEICIGLPSATAKFYVNGYDFLTKCWTDAVKGTKLEGKLTFTKDDTIGNGFSDALKINQVNLLFGVGWQGSSLNPYGLVGAYTWPQYQYDPSWDTSSEMLEVTLDGVTYTATVLDWTNTLAGDGPIEIAVVGEDGMPTDETIVFNGNTSCPAEHRLAVLGSLEGAILRTYDLLPLNNESSAALKGMQIKYYTEEYVYGVGRGGIKYMTYNYTDGEWDAFVKSQGGEINYK